ncbi:MAG: glutathione S-transferase family protein [Rhodospirillaceae bacterium]
MIRASRGGQRLDAPGTQFTLEDALTMKVYGAILSPYVCRVMLALRYKGIDHEVLMPKDGMKSPEYLKLNPLAKMPAIKDGATVLPESSVIVEYIEDKHPKKPIIPGTAKGAATARLIATISDLYIQAAVSPLFKQRDPKTRDKDVVKSALADVQHGLSVLDGYLVAGGPWAMGKRFTIADCYAMPALYFVNMVVPLFGVKDPFAEHKNVKKYWNSLKRDALTKQAMKEMNAMAKQFFGI